MTMLSKARRTTGLILLTLASALTAAGQEAAAPTPYRLALPFRNWALDLDLSAFNLPMRVPPPGGAAKKDAGPRVSLPVEQVTGDGGRYQLMILRSEKGKSDSSSMLMINFRPALIEGTAEDFRDFHLKNLSKSKSFSGDKPKASEYNGVPVASYKISSAFVSPDLGFLAFAQSGRRTRQAYFVRDGVWVTIALTAGDKGEADEQMFYSLLDSARFVDTSAPSTSFDYYHLGRALYLARDYYKAVEPLTRAVALEHRQRRLDTASWRDAVAKLVDSLAVSGEVKRSKELIDYAVASDPTYPLFELALARYYAAENDLDNTLIHLEKAFLHKENALYGPLPDPLEDSLLERFRKDERFRKAVKSMKKK